MAKYISSGKFNPGKTILGLLIAVPAALLLGIIYAWAMDLIPFIIVEVIVFALVVVLLAAVAVSIVRMASIRNNFVKIILALVVSLVAWYSQWVYTVEHDYWKYLLRFDRVFSDILEWTDNHEISISHGTSSSSGGGITGWGLIVMYGFELLFFFTPVLLVFKMQKNYYCESCEAFNADEEYYVKNLDEFRLPAAEESGDFRFLNDLPWHRGEGNPGKEWKVEFSYCTKCRQNGVINISSGRFVANRKGRIEFKTDHRLVKSVLLSNLSTETLISKTPQTTTQI